MIPNTICMSEKCFCGSGYIAKLDKSACVLNVDYNDGCLESAQCQTKLGMGAVCEQGKCVCGEDFSKVSYHVANETRIICEKSIVVGQSCVYDTECYHSRLNGTEQSMYCSSKECRVTRFYTE